MEAGETGRCRVVGLKVKAMRTEMRRLKRAEWIRKGPEQRKVTVTGVEFRIQHTSASRRVGM